MSACRIVTGFAHRMTGVCEDALECGAYRLLGLCGVAGVGKDHTFGLLSRVYPNAKRIAFADPLKSILIATDPKVGGDGKRLSDLLYEMTFEQAKRRNIEVRRLLQHLGTEGIRRHLGDDIWIKEAFKKCEPEPVLNVFTDVRFPNEALAIKEAGGIIVRVVRPDLPRPFPRHFEHVSETGVDGIKEDFVFVNDGRDSPLNDLYDFVSAHLNPV